MSPDHPGLEDTMAVTRRKTHFLIALVASVIDAVKRDMAGNRTSLGVPQVGNYGPISAPANIHAQFAAGAPINTSAGITYTPFPRRNIQCTFGAGGAACFVTILGTDPFGAPQSEVINTAGGPAVVQGVKVWGSVTTIQSNIDPGGTVDVQTGGSFFLGFTTPPGAPFTLAVDGVVGTTAAGPATNLPAGIVRPTTAPNGAHVYTTLAVFGSLPSPTFVHLDQTETPRQVAAGLAAATDIPSAQALLGACVAVYTAHRLDTAPHLAVDTTNTTTTPVPTPGDLNTTIDRANELAGDFNAHLTNGGGAYHPNVDTQNVEGAPTVAHGDSASLYALVNDLRTKLNAHLSAGLATPSWRLTDG